MKIVFYKIIDKFLGIPLCWIFHFIDLFFSRHVDIKKILVIKLWAVGDSIVMLPFIDSLKNFFPSAEIDILARKRNFEIFKYNNEISRIHLYEPKCIFKILAKFKEYDAVFDAEPYLNLSALLSFWLGKTKIGFSNQPRSIIYDYKITHRKDQHMVQNYLDMIRILGIKAHYKNLIPINSGDEDKEKVSEFLKDINCEMIGFCTGTAESASKTRIWNDEKWASLADLLIEKYNCKIIFVGARNEKEKVDSIIKLMKKEAINSCGEFSLLQTCELIKRLQLFVSIDTGPMHISAAQGVKTIGLFGPNTPTLWAPYGKYNISIYKKLSCSPCIINDKGRMPDCLRKTERYACMREITVDEVLRAVNYLKQKQLLKKNE